MSTLRERFAAVRDSTRTRTTQSPTTSSAPAGSTTAPRHAPAAPAPRPAPQGEIFEALSATLPPAPVARSGAAPSAAPSPCPPPSAPATPASVPQDAPPPSDVTARGTDRAPRSKGRRSNNADDVQAASARKLPASKVVLIGAGVLLLLALFIGMIAVKRGLLASLKQRRAAKKKAASADRDGGDPADDDDGDDGQDDGDDNEKGAGGKVGGMLGGFFGAKDKPAAANTAKRVRTPGSSDGGDPRQSRAAGAVPPMDPYHARATRPPASSPVRAPAASHVPAHGGQPGAVGPHGPALQQQQPPPPHAAYQQPPPPSQQQQQQAPHPAYQQPPPPQQAQAAALPPMQAGAPQQAHRQASPTVAQGHGPHQQHPPYAPHVQARLDGVPHPNMPPPTPQAARMSPGGGRP
nr:DNA pol iii gamma/tau subunit-like domain [Pandoravirus massiliensis]